MKWTESDAKRVLDYLSQKVDIFKEVRNKFNIGDELGLVSFPTYHKYSPAFIDRCILKDGDVYIDNFSVKTPLHSLSFLGSKKIPKEQIILKPVFKGIRAYLVSLYFPAGVMENKKGINLDESFFQIPDEAIKGLIAHECAEYLLHFNKRLLPFRLRIALRIKMRIALWRFRIHPSEIHSYFRDQCPSDFLASMFGYKEEILAVLKFLEESLLRQEDFPSDDKFRSSREIAKEIRVRADFIKGLH